MSAASSNSVSQGAQLPECAKQTLVHSGAKPGLRELSNLYSGKEIVFSGLKYPSAEAIYQAQKTKSPEKFTTEGLFNNKEYITPRINEGRPKSVSTHHWEKKQMMGILAKWVIRRPFMFGIEFVHEFDSDEYEEWTTAKSTWFPIFEAKFADSDMLNLLLKTEGLIVEFDRFAKPKTKWGGKVMPDKTVIGRNMMGKLLTAFRDSKRPKRKREEEDAEPVKALKTMTQEQVIAAAFAKAEAEGNMIELDQDLPDGWEGMDALDKATYAYANNWTHAQWQEHLPDLAVQPKPSAPAVDDYLHEPNANGGIAPVVPAYDPTVPAGASAAGAAGGFTPLGTGGSAAPQSPPSSPFGMEAPDAMPNPPWQLDSPPYSPSSPAYSPSSPAAKSSSSAAASSSAASSAAASGASAAGHPFIAEDSDEEMPAPAEPIDCTAICVTFSDAVESDTSGQTVYQSGGEPGDGFTKTDLEDLREQTGLTSQMYVVHGENNGEVVTGHVLVFRSVLPTKQQSVMDELCNIPRAHIDTQFVGYGSCKNKSRWNTNLTDKKVEGDMGNLNAQLRHPSQFPFSELPQISLVRKELTRWGRLTGLTGLMDMIAEVNYYGITPPGKETPTHPPGIGWHIDGERNKVVGVSFGRIRKLRLCAYDGIQPIGPVTEIKLRPGDIYLFDTAASGTSYRGLHIRHCASAGRANRHYLNQLDKALLNKLKKKKAAMQKAGKEWDTSDETDRMLSGQPRSVQNTLC